MMKWLLLAGVAYAQEDRCTNEMKPWCECDDDAPHGEAGSCDMPSKVNAGPNQEIGWVDNRLICHKNFCKPYGVKIQRECTHNSAWVQTSGGCGTGACGPTPPIGPANNGEQTVADMNLDACKETCFNSPRCAGFHYEGSETSGTCYFHEDNECGTNAIEAQQCHTLTRGSCDTLDRLVCAMDLTPKLCKIPCLHPTCNGNGICNPRGLCICDQFFEGNMCETEIEEKVEILEGGIESYHLAIIIVVWLLFPIVGFYLMVKKRQAATDAAGG